MKHYTVSSDMGRNGPYYFVQSSDGQRMPGEFDSPVNAQDLADFLNKEEEDAAYDGDE